MRTSKEDQNPDLQRRDLLAFGCEKIFEEQSSSCKEDRPELRVTLEFCRQGDELVVWKQWRLPAAGEAHPRKERPLGRRESEDPRTRAGAPLPQPER